MFSRLWLRPRLAELKRRHPEILPEVVYDMAEFVAGASPAYLKEHGKPRTEEVAALLVVLPGVARPRRGFSPV